MIFTIILLSQSVIFAGGGEITGRVTDKATDEPLPFANIIILGINYGAATDENGNYRISQIPPGTYTIVAKFLGYDDVRFENVQVLINRITRIDFELPQKTLKVSREVVVQAKRPAVDLEVASTAKVITSKELQNMTILTNVKDLVALQSGVVKVGEDIHIRGGRSDEVLYLIDGVPARNPVTGINAIDIDINQIEQVEIITGGFDAEYGNANSGVINIITKSGRNRYTADMVYRSDVMMPNRLSTNYSYGYFGLSGPFEPFSWMGMPGTSGFTISAKTDMDDSYYKIGGGYGTTRFLFWDLPNRQFTNYSLSAQLNYEPISSFRIKIQGQFDRGEKKYFNYAWKYLPENLPIDFYRTDRITVLINHTLSKNAFYNLNFGFTQGKDKNSLLGLGSPLERFTYSVQYYDHDGNPIDYETALYLLEHNPSAIDFSRTQVNYQRPPIAKDSDYDGFIDKGEFSDYHKNQYCTYSADFDLTYFLGAHKMKGGFSFTLNDINHFDIWDYGQYYPHRDTIPGEWPEYGGSRWYFNDKIWNGSFYLQDRINYAGMFLNVGTRADYYGHGDLINDPYFIRQFNLASGENIKKFDKVKIVWSPRLGLSIPANKSTKLFFNYGYFIQQPGFTELYRDPFLTSVVGNPNLNPRKSINYEVGMETEFIKNYILNIKLYGRDYAGDIGYRETDTNPVRLIYDNIGFGSARGFEIEFRKVYSNFFSFTTNYTYLMARGFDLTALHDYETGSTVPPSVREQRVAWDVNHNFKLMFNFEILEHDKLIIWRLALSDFGFYFLMTANLGRPYTPIIPGSIYIEPNSSNAPGEFYLDATLYKGFRLGHTRFVFYSEIKNLFNYRNVNLGSAFNRRTGRIVNLGDLAGGSNRYYTFHEVEIMRNNMAFSPGRLIRFGIKLYLR